MSTDLYQQVILDHAKKPRNFGVLADQTHKAEGFNPLCGDHLWVYLKIDADGHIEELTFQGDGCAISRASASMMTQSVKGKTIAEAQKLFTEFHKLVVGELKPDSQPHNLGKLAIFSGIWQYPSRVKCAALAWHTLNGALKHDATVTTE